MTRQTHQILIAARQLIANPDNWTQGVLARDRDDDPTDPLNPAACKFCMVGALMMAARAKSDEFPEIDVAVNASLPDSYTSNVDGDYTQFNDDPQTTHDEVLEVFDRAIAMTMEHHQKLPPRKRIAVVKRITAGLPEWEKPRRMAEFIKIEPYLARYSMNNTPRQIADEFHALSIMERDC